MSPGVSLTLVDSSEHPEPSKEAPAASFSARDHAPQGANNLAAQGT